MEDPQRAPDLERTADDRFWSGDLDGSIEAFEHAYALYLEQGTERRAGLMAVNLAQFHSNRGNAAVSMGWHQKALRHLEDELDCEEKAWLVALQVGDAHQTGDVERAVALSDELRRMARAVGSHDLEVAALAHRGALLARRGETPEGMTLLDEAMAAAVSGQLNRYIAGTSFCLMLTTCQALGDFGRATQWIEQAQRSTSSDDVMGFPGDCRIHRAGMLRMQGAWDEAMREAQLACAEADSWVHPGQAEFEVGMLHLHKGQLADAEDAFRRGHARGREPQPGLALIAVARGDLQGAARAIATCLEVEGASDVERSELLAVGAEIASEAGEMETADRAMAAMDALEAQHPTLVVRARAAHARGALLVARGSSTEALSVLTSALHLWREIGAPYEMAHTRRLLARAYESAGDVDRARLELEAARDEFVRLGASLDARNAAEKLRRRSPGPGLTPRELQVLERVAGGRTNKEIAAELSVSVATVERHVANVYRKIGVRSRVEATAYALGKRPSEAADT